MTRLFAGSISEIRDHDNWDEILEVGERFGAQWGQVTLRSVKWLFANPPDSLKPSKLLPQKNKDLVWTSGEIPKAWLTWAKQNKVEVVAVAPLTKDKVRKMLGAGVRHLTFTETGIDWFMVALRDPNKSRLMGLLTLLLLAYPEPKELDGADVGRVLGGEDQERAAKILKTLGTETAVRLAAHLPKGKRNAVTLLHYLKTALAHRHDPVLVFLETVWKGANDLRYTYEMAVLLFTMCCLELSRSKEKGAKSTSSDVIARTLDLYRISGTSLLTGGNTMGPSWL
jgi:hypothetical protein